MLNINIEKSMTHYCMDEPNFSQHIIDTCDAITRAQWAAEREDHSAKQAREFEEARARGNAKFLEDIQKPEFAYARKRHFGTMAYMRCPGSPTGVTAGATADNDFAKEALAKLNRAAPLSPTEGQHRSGANLYR